MFKYRERCLCTIRNERVWPRERVSIRREIIRRYRLLFFLFFFWNNSKKSIFSLTVRNTKRSATNLFFFFAPRLRTNLAETSGGSLTDACPRIFSWNRSFRRVRRKRKKCRIKYQFQRLGNCFSFSCDSIRLYSSRCHRQSALYAKKKKEVQIKLDIISHPFELPFRSIRLTIDSFYYDKQISTDNCLQL